MEQDNQLNIENEMSSFESDAAAVDMLSQAVNDLYRCPDKFLDLTHWPAETTVENILSLSMKARGVQKVPFVWFWPDGARGCLTLTHDVETKAGRDHCAELMNGCCTVMPFFIGDVRELHVLNERSIDLWKSQIDLILRKNGLVSFIVHPDYVKEPDTRFVYEKLLSYLRELRGRTHLWCALPSEINTWWRARSKMSVVNDDHSWRIEGDGADRALLAYAKNVDSKLIYELSDATRTQ